MPSAAGRWLPLLLSLEAVARDTAAAVAAFSLSSIVAIAAWPGLGGPGQGWEPEWVSGAAPEIATRA